MTCEFRFLDVGNGDCIIIRPDAEPVVVVDVADPRKLFTKLDALGIKKLGQLFVTHGHADHVPHLYKLELFLTDWLKRGNQLGRLYLPRNLLQADLARLEKLQVAKPEEAERGMRALERLVSYEDDEIIAVTNADRGVPPVSVGDLVIEVLHPSYSRQESAPFDKTKPNALSLVLRLTYGSFAAMLLGDLEGSGIAACLKLRPQRLRAQLVKIPHHGAWPANGPELEALLATIQPKFAVLSVGSTNSYKHVAPELFGALLGLQGSLSTKFVCTQVTRTCQLPSAQRSGMGDKGLQAEKTCAGEVHIIAEKEGTFNHAGAAAHLATVASIPHAACTSRVDLGFGGGLVNLGPPKKGPSKKAKA